MAPKNWQASEEIVCVWVLYLFSRLMNLTLKLFLLLRPLVNLSPTSLPFFQFYNVFSEKSRALYIAENADAALI